MANRKRIKPDLPHWQRISELRHGTARLLMGITPSEETYVQVNDLIARTEEDIDSGACPERPVWLDQLEQFAQQLEVEGFGSEHHWRRFLAGHPELVDAAIEDEPPADERSAQVELDDDSTIAALARADERWSEHFAHMRWPRPHAGAWAADVARELGRGTPGDAIRVGQQLARLAREGRILRVSKPHQSKRYATLPCGGGLVGRLRVVGWSGR